MEKCVTIGNSKAKPAVAEKGGSCCNGLLPATNADLYFGEANNLSSLVIKTCVFS